MKKRNSVTFIFFLIFLLFPSGIAFSQSPIRLAILPFKIYAPQDLSYFQQGLSGMLKTRLSWTEHIEVVDIDKKALNELKDIKKLGQELELDYVLSGSLTVFGNSASIDLTLTQVENGKVTTFFAECSNLDQVIPRIGKLSTKIMEAMVPSLKKEPARALTAKRPKKSEVSSTPETNIKTLLYIAFIPGSLKINKPQIYHLFLSDKPQVKGEDPIVDEEDIEVGEANFPDYRRAGEMEKQGLDLGKVRVVKKQLNFIFDVTEFTNKHPSKRYFLAVKKEAADYFLAMEVWFKRGSVTSQKTKICFQTGILGSLLNQKMQIDADALEFSIKALAR